MRLNARPLFPRTARGIRWNPSSLALFALTSLFNSISPYYCSRVLARNRISDQFLGQLVVGTLTGVGVHIHIVVACFFFFFRLCVRIYTMATLWRAGVFFRFVVLDLPLSSALRLVES